MKPAPMKPVPPTTDLERGLRERGFSCIVGFDEVGKGAWAGPLMIGAAVLRAEMLDAANPAELMGGVRDSKQIAESKRDGVFESVSRTAAAWAVGAASAQECDLLGMNAAQRLAAKRAIDELIKNFGVRPDAAIVDGRWDFISPHVSRVITEVRADTSCLSVAAASVVAKVTRDNLMRQCADEYPQWHFDTNKGYPCPKHRAALQGYGPCAIHRQSWAFMPNYVPWLRVDLPVARSRQQQHRAPHARQ